MIAATSFNQSLDLSCHYDIDCRGEVKANCPACGRAYCSNHYVKHRKQVKEDFRELLRRQKSYDKTFHQYISKSSAEIIFESIEQIYELKKQFGDIQYRTNDVEQQLKNLLDEEKQDSSEQSKTMAGLENEIDQLKEEIFSLTEKIQKMDSRKAKRLSSRKSRSSSSSGSLEQESFRTSDPSSADYMPKRRKPSRSLTLDIPRNETNSKINENSVLSYLLFQQVSPSILDFSGDQSKQDEQEEQDDEEVMMLLDPSTSLKVMQKIRLSNNVVRVLKGPFKTMVEGTMHAFDVWAQNTHISEAVLQAVQQAIDKQKQPLNEDDTSNSSKQFTFAEITSDWKFEGENPDRGYSSPSIWMRDPQGRHILVKIQELPLCAANEWLAYVLGRRIGLPVNEVKIGCYENNLVTLHVDVASEDEKTMTYMDLPKRKRRAILATPMIECMDLFDHIIQNVDRNQRNILITMPKDARIDDDTTKLKVHLIDHSNCFGMGKLNGISLVAAKFHSQHLAIVKFDPERKSRQFERYLNRLPLEDRPLISKTLNRFASITDEQFDMWINEVRDLLSNSQYDRIRTVLRRQRDIAQRYIRQWGIDSRPTSCQDNKWSTAPVQTNDTMVYL